MTDMLIPDREQARERDRRSPAADEISSSTAASGRPATAAGS